MDVSRQGEGGGGGREEGEGEREGEGTRKVWNMTLGGKGPWYVSSIIAACIAMSHITFDSWIMTSDKLNTRNDLRILAEAF